MQHVEVQRVEVQHVEVQHVEVQHVEVQHGKNIRHKQHGGALTEKQKNLKYYYLEIFRHPFNDTLINVEKEKNMLNARLDEIGEEKMNTPATIIPGEELIRPYRNRFSSDSFDRRGSVRKRYY